MILCQVTYPLVHLVSLSKGDPKAIPPLAYN